jgi:organic hydroperoxide reductase OsmC/OhrA
VLVDVKYTTFATATGGRDGGTRTDDGKVAVELSIPRSWAVPASRQSSLYICLAW